VDLRDQYEGPCLHFRIFIVVLIRLFNDRPLPIQIRGTYESISEQKAYSRTTYIKAHTHSRNLTIALATGPLPTTMSLSFSSPPWSYDSTSPYPPSSPSTSDFEYDGESTHATAYLHSSIAILPEAELRNLMLKLASKDPHFQRAITKELSRIEAEFSPTLPTTPTPAKQRKWHRKSRRNVKNLSISTKSLCAQLHHEIEYTYHPGTPVQAQRLLAPNILGCTFFQVVSKKKSMSSSQCFLTRLTSSAKSRCGVAATMTSGVRGAYQPPQHSLCIVWINRATACSHLPNGVRHVHHNVHSNRNALEFLGARNNLRLSQLVKWLTFFYTYTLSRFPYHVNDQTQSTTHFLMHSFR